MTIHHGIKNTEIADAPRPLVEASSAVIGLIAIGDETTDTDTFPLDTATLITDVRTAIGKAGTDGTLVKSLSAIADHCSPVIIVVRVAEGEDDAGTQANLIGTTTVDGKLTGMKALLSAFSNLGFRPNILGIPGYDNQAVTAALITIAQKLDASIYARADGDTLAAAIAYKAHFTDRAVDLIWPEWTGWGGEAVARALGLRALLDQTIGWHQSLSNQPVLGVTGISQDVYFDLSGVGTDAAALNSAPITTLIRKPGGGFCYWGNRTCSEDQDFAFEVAVRTGQVIRQTIRDAEAPFLDQPMTPALVKTIIDTVQRQFDSWVTQGRLMGGRIWYDGDLNTSIDLSAGKLALSYDYTPVAPLESLTNNEHITDKYYLNFGDQIAALG